MPMRLSLTVEETNRLRQRLGLRLIPKHSNETSGDSTSKAQAEKLVSKIHRATSRVETQKLEQEATTSDLITSKPAKSTDSWLAEMKARKLEPGSQLGISSPGISMPLRANHPIAADKDDLVGPNVGTSAHETLVTRPPVDITNPEISEAGPSVRNSSNVGYSNETVAPDPLEPASDSQNVLRKTTTETTAAPKAVFKPKKSKSRSTSRKRTVTDPSSVMPATGSEETDHFDSMLMRSKVARNNSHDAAPPSEPHIFNSKSNEGLIINPLNLIKSSLEHTSEQEPGLRPPISAPANQEDALDESEDASKTTHMNGVAAVLEQLRDREVRPAAQPRSTANSRAWAKTLSKARLARAQELKKAEVEYRNLPSRERDQAMELHKQRLLREQALEAQKLEAHYEPQIKIEHHDEKGKRLDAKEAFKELSRAFHG